MRLLSRHDDVKRPFRQALPWICFMTLLFVFNYSARSLLSPLLVTIETDFSVGHAQATTLLLMQSVSYSATLFMSGFLLSRICAAHVVTFATVGGGLVFMFMPLATSFGTLQVMFLLYGATAGFYVPAALAVLSSISRLSDWGKTVATHELAPPLSFMILPVVAQFALAYTTWQGVFFGLGVCMVVTGGLFLLFGRGGRNCVPPTPLNNCMKLLVNPVSLSFTLLLIISMVGEFSIFSILQVYFVDTLHYSPAKANHMLALSRLISPFAVIAGGLAADRYNPFWVIRACLLLHGAGLALMAVPSELPALCGVVLQSVAVSLIFPSVFKALAVCFSMGEQPILLSLGMPLASLFSVGGVPFFLGYCGQYYTFGAGLLVLAVVSVLCILPVPLMERNRHDATAER